MAFRRASTASFALLPPLLLPFQFSTASSILASNGGRAMLRFGHRGSAVPAITRRSRSTIASNLLRPTGRYLRAFSSDTSSSSTSSSKDGNLPIVPNFPPTAQIRLLHDGDCPLCEREIAMLRRRSDDRGGVLDFVDISSQDYLPEENQNIDYETAMGRIHGILPDGTIVRDIEVFKRAYEAVGLGWVYNFTKVEPLRKAADFLYKIWARNRLSVTGRPELEQILSEKKTCKP